MRIIDLTLELADGTQTHPAHPRCVVIEFATHAGTAAHYRPPCQGSASRLLMLSDHLGTHIDSPFHYIPTGGTIESVPLERVVGPAIYLDVSDKAPGQPVTPAMLERAEETAGVSLQRGEILLLRMWSGTHYTDTGFLGCAGLDAAAAKWVAARGAKALGCDLASPDDPQDLGRPVHMTLLGQGILILEHLVHLETLPGPRFQFVALPLLIRGATASPVRAIAIFGEEVDRQQGQAGH